MKFQVKKHTLFLKVFAFILLIISCQTQPDKKADVYPDSDKTNEGGWILNEDFSDEFEGPELDDSKWYVTGTDGR